MRVLYLEDDEQLSKLVLEYLNDKLIIDLVCNLTEAVDYLSSYHYDVVLLDRNIHGEDVGMSLIENIKRINEHTGVIVLSAYSTIDDKIDGLDLGADDYMEKPYNLKELYARIQALYRRNVPRIIHLDTMYFDTSSKRIFQDDTELFLTNKENELFFYLLINKNQVISHEQLLHAMYVHPEDIASNTLNVRINAIRKKLSIDCIKNIKTRGYILEIK